MTYSLVFHRSLILSTIYEMVNTPLNSKIFRTTLCEKCPYSELFWSAFSRIRTEYGEIRNISLTISVRMRKHTDQNNSEYGHFLRRTIVLCQSLVLSFDISQNMNTPSVKILLTILSLNWCGIKLPFVNNASQKQIQFEWIVRLLILYYSIEINVLCIVVNCVT